MQELYIVQDRFGVVKPSLDAMTLARMYSGTDYVGQKSD